MEDIHESLQAILIMALEVLNIRTMSLEKEAMWIKPEHNCNKVGHNVGVCYKYQ